MCDYNGFCLNCEFCAGTPPRLDGRTIDFSRAKPSLADCPPVPFSFVNDKVWIKVVSWEENNFLTAAAYSLH